jgi:hypothetical protein
MTPSKAIVPPLFNKFPASYNKPTANGRVHESLPPEASRKQTDPVHSFIDSYHMIPIYS